MYTAHCFFYNFKQYPTQIPSFSQSCMQDISSAFLGYIFIIGAYIRIKVHEIKYGSIKRIQTKLKIPSINSALIFCASVFLLFNFLAQQISLWHIKSPILNENFLYRAHLSFAQDPAVKGITRVNFRGANHLFVHFLLFSYIS